jgi:hypothetical protein
MKCMYCGKEFKGEGCSISAGSAGEKAIAVYCTVDCMTKAFKKMTRLMRKLSKEEIMKIIDPNNNFGKEKNK